MQPTMQAQNQIRLFPKKKQIRFWLFLFII